MPSTDLDQAIKEVVAASYEMYGDWAVEEELERYFRDRAEQIRSVDNDQTK
jgi:hypothetical protein